MAIRKRRITGQDTRLAFEALSIEGGLLSPEWLTRAARLEAGSQAEADYRIPRGLNLRDEIGRYWRISQAHWSDFTAARAAGADSRTISTRFVLSLLRECFGFSSLGAADPVTIGDHAYPIGHAALDGRVPVVIVGADDGLDKLLPAYGDPGRRRSAFGLIQEYLNAQEGALWGLCSDGCTLRILRDNVSLTRPAWIEADLQRIFTEERYADFAALWLIAHETRFGRPDQPVTECALELWRNAGREEGTRARDQLRQGVEDALLVLGQGFLTHPDNNALRAALASGELTTTEYFNQLLRMVYRVIFLLTAEERDLLHPPGSDPKGRKLYEDGYGMRRLRDRSVRRNAHDRFFDLWESVKIVFSGLAEGQPVLALPALSGIFQRSMCPTLDAARLENRALLFAVYRLSWIRDAGALSRVNWRDMGPEELGSVYESLLELVPQVSTERRTFAFAGGAEARGNARKTSGSYYTPDSLVQVLLDSALEPVIADTLARHPSRPVEALLELTIVDPACGSGHFLLAAARRLAVHVARATVGGTPSAAEYRHALRQVVGRCIFGVDLNPMAVELCRVALWMEAVDPGKPLSFLVSHIQHGNALLGTTPELMEKGIPDAAWDPIEGDDKKTASALKKRNKAAARGQMTMESLWTGPEDASARAVADAIAGLEADSDADPEALARKRAHWEQILVSAEYRRQKFLADTWCAAFVWPKQPGDLAAIAPTNELWWSLRAQQGHATELLESTVQELATQYRFFHWHLQFPQVFARGGFDCVLGNPPWERVKLQEQEFFASRSGAIAGAANSAARKKLIARLPEDDPPLWTDWCLASRKAEGESHFVRQSARFPLCGRGDVNTYALFAEHNRCILNPQGRSGTILPSGVVTDDTTKEFFQSLVDQSSLVSIYHFENEDKVFPEVHHAFRFLLLTLTNGKTLGAVECVFYARNTRDLVDPARRFSLSPADFAILNPNTRTCPTFRSRRDADINLAAYRKAGVLWREDDEENGNPWKLRFCRMLDMSNDSGLFRTEKEFEDAGWRREGNRFTQGGEVILPLFEAKMVHLYDHRFSTYEGQTEAQANQGKLPELDDVDHADPDKWVMPRYWVAEKEVASRLDGRWSRGWMLGWRDICRSSDTRTVIASVIPRVGVNHKFLLMMPGSHPLLVSSLFTNLCSFLLDYYSRQKVGGTGLPYFTMRQLPVLPPATYDAPTPWQPPVVLRTWILPRVLELTYTAWDLEAFAHDVGFDGPPFKWDSERRFQLRCELDAAFFHLYGLSRDDTAYVMDTFPIVRKNDEKAHGEYRTKRVILELYDQLAMATRTGRPWVSSLDPPPADPRQCHPDTRNDRP